MSTTRIPTGVEQLTHYRHLITLPDGLRVLLRPLTPKDRDALVALFHALSPEEVQYFRNNMANPERVIDWAEDPEHIRAFPLAAMVGDRLVGNSTLYLGRGATRHVAEIRVFLAKEFRRRGIGTAMLTTQIEVARKLGLHQLVAEIVESQPRVIHAFEHLGFKRQCVLKEQFMGPDGSMLDLIIMINFLKPSAGKF